MASLHMPWLGVWATVAWNTYTQAHQSGSFGWGNRSPYMAAQSFKNVSGHRKWKLPFSQGLDSETGTVISAIVYRSKQLQSLPRFKGVGWGMAFSVRGLAESWAVFNLPLVVWLTQWQFWEGEVTIREYRFYHSLAFWVKIYHAQAQLQGKFILLFLVKEKKTSMKLVYRQGF